jgi:hypothetical protein
MPQSKRESTPSTSESPTAQELGGRPQCSSPPRGNPSQPNPDHQCSPVKQPHTAPFHATSFIYSLKLGREFTLSHQPNTSWNVSPGTTFKIGSTECMCTAPHVAHVFPVFGCLAEVSAQVGMHVRRTHVLASLWMQQVNCMRKMMVCVMWD